VSVFTSSDPEDSKLLEHTVHFRNPTFASKQWPGSGLNCLVYADFAGQRPRMVALETRHTKRVSGFGLLTPKTQTEDLTPETRDPTPETCNPKLRTRNQKHRSFDPNPNPPTLGPRPSALNPSPEILNPKPATLNSQLSNLYPQPSSFNPYSRPLLLDTYPTCGCASERKHHLP